MYDNPMFIVAIGNEPVTVGLTTGHAISIPPEGRMVPPQFLADAFRTGRVAVGGQPQQSEQTPVVPVQHQADASKIEHVKGVIRAALDAGDESFLTAQGIPDARKLDGMAGMKVSASERDRAWAELQAEAGQ